MADPEGYVPQYDFSGFQATNPTQPLPGHELDVELQNVSEAIGQTQTALSDIRRPDGKLKNGVVTPESAAPGFIESVAGLAYGALEVIDGYGAELTHFSQTWLGARAEDPATGLAGAPLYAGQMYYNTVAGEYRTYDGATWQFHSGISQLDTYHFVSAEDQAAFFGTDNGGQTVAVAPHAVLVSVNGSGPLVEGVDFTVRLAGDGIEFAAALALGDKVQITSFRQVNLTAVSPQVAADATRAENAAAAASTAASASAASASAIGARFYSSVAEFNAATIDPSVDTVIIRTGTEVLMYSREPGASGPDDLSHPSGSQWAKASLTTADLLAAVTDVISAGRFPTYVEGTFLPELTWSDKVSGIVNYGSRFGSYVRIGRMVYIDMSFFSVTVARGTEAGTIQVANLPYRAAANTYGTLQLRRADGIDLRDTGSNPPASVAALIAAGQTYGVLTITPANAASFSAGVARCSAAANAVTLQLTGWYEVQD